MVIVRSVVIYNDKSLNVQEKSSCIGDPTLIQVSSVLWTAEGLAELVE